MKDEKNSGFTLVPFLIAGIFIIVIAGLGLTQLTGNYKTSSPSNIQPKHGELSQNQPRDQENSGGYGMKKPFYTKDGISLQHYWPSEGSFSAEETEILLINENSSDLQVKSFNLTYAVENKAYPHKSGTWEKFPSRQSWERTEYINISSQYYQHEPLILFPGQKGKLHWHMQFGSKPLDGKQTVTIKITLIKDGQTINIDEQFTRPSGTVVSKEDH